MNASNNNITKLFAMCVISALTISSASAEGGKKGATIVKASKSTFVAAKPTKQAAPTRPEQIVKQFQPTTRPTEEAVGGGYTSLIIDVRGLGIERSMSPVIRREDGTAIWSGEGATADYTIDEGIVAYATNMEDARSNARAGKSPLVVKATAIHAHASKSDPILSAEDMDIVVQSAKRDGFFKKFRVIFLTD